LKQSRDSRKSKSSALLTSAISFLRSNQEIVERLYSARDLKYVGTYRKQSRDSRKFLTGKCLRRLERERKQSRDSRKSRSASTTVTSSTTPSTRSNQEIVERCAAVQPTRALSLEAIKR